MIRIIATGTEQEIKVRASHFDIPLNDVEMSPFHMVDSVLSGFTFVLSDDYDNEVDDWFEAGKHETNDIPGAITYCCPVNKADEFI